jgi:hypothetical protein
MTTYDKNEVLGLLNSFVHTKPGLESGNYADAKSYNREKASITQQLMDARKMINFCLLHSVRFTDWTFSAYAGRLVYTPPTKHVRASVEYHAGQYYPTEFRAAVCAVLSSAIQDYHRECGYTIDEIREQARKELGYGIANRWF